MLRKKTTEEHNLTVINTQHLRLTPPDHLAPKEQEIFREIVDTCDPRHFRKAELPVLCSYVTAVSFSRWYSRKINAGEDADGTFHRRWLETTKLVALLASRLRLAPSTRLDSKTVERRPTSEDNPPWLDD